MASYNGLVLNVAHVTRVESGICPLYKPHVPFLGKCAEMRGKYFFELALKILLVPLTFHTKLQSMQ